MSARGTSKFFSVTLPEIPNGFCAVYAIGPVEDRRPIKIGYSKRPHYRISEFQVANYKQLGVLAMAWVADRRLARRIEQRCHRILTKAKKVLSGEWFDIDADWAKKVIAVAAQEEGIPWRSIDDLRRMEEIRTQIAMGDIDKMMEWSDRRQLVASKG